MSTEIAILSKEIAGLQKQFNALKTNMPTFITPINTTLISINATLLETKNILKDMWDTEEMVGFWGWLDRLNSATDALNNTKALLNALSLENIVNMLDENAGMKLINAAIWAEEQALTTLAAVKKLFNIETWKSIGLQIKEAANTAANTAAKWLQNTAETALNAVKNVSNFIKNSSILLWIKETAATIADTVAKGAQKAITVVVTAAKAALNFVMSLNPITLIIIAIVALIATFALLWNKCEGFRNFWINLFDVVKNIAINVFEIFKERFKSIIEFVKNTIANIKQIFSGIVEFIKGVFTGDWKRAFEGLKTIISGVFNQLKNIVKTPINFLIDGINLLLKGLNKVKFSIPDWVPVIGGKDFGINIPLIPRLADGGFPSTGQMFIAREAGPELVGTIGNRNAVVNNNQIVESVSAGVYRAVREAMRGSGSGNSNPLEVNLYLDGRQITAAVERVQKERGLSLMSGSLTYA